MLKQFISAFLLFALTISSAFAFVNCQWTYDNDKRSLPSKRGNCAVCHVDTAGRGPQNEFGKAFLKAGKKITNELVAQFPDLFIQSEGGSTGPTPKAPLVKRVKPKKVRVNTQSRLKVKGKNFVSDSIALIDENEVLTTFKSNMLLILDVVLDKLGVHTLKVRNPDEQESNTVKVKAKQNKK